MADFVRCYTSAAARAGGQTGAPSSGARGSTRVSRNCSFAGPRRSRLAVASDSRALSHCRPEARADSPHRSPRDRSRSGLRQLGRTQGEHEAAPPTSEQPETRTRQSRAPSRCCTSQTSMPRPRSIGTSSASGSTPARQPAVLRIGGARRRELAPEARRRAGVRGRCRGTRRAHHGVHRYAERTRTLRGISGR